MYSSSYSTLFYKIPLIVLISCLFGAWSEDLYPACRERDLTQRTVVSGCLLQRPPAACHPNKDLLPTRRPRRTAVSGCMLHLGRRPYFRLACRGGRLSAAASCSGPRHIQPSLAPQRSDDRDCDCDLTRAHTGLLK